MNQFVIKDILIDHSRISYDYDIIGDWKRYFDPVTKFYVDYGEDITGIPKSLAAVPLICNVIVLASLLNAKIYTPSLDMDFYNSIQEFMPGFEKMYPMIKFNYQDIIVCDNIEDTKPLNLNLEQRKSLLYFSGGVDAYTSLIRHEEEKPLLFTVGGADTSSINTSGFSEIIRKNHEIAENHNLSVVFCVSTLREFIDEKQINELIYPRIQDFYWHAIQHGLGMFGLSAGLVYLHNLEKIYFASSFCETDKNYSCGSDPSIDNFVRIGSAYVCHDGFELSRQEKVCKLIDYAKAKRTPVKLRVCYSSSSGKNCCTCEKCTRTILSILCEGGNPKDFGFEDYEPNDLYKNAVEGIFKLCKKPDVAISIYDCIIRKYKNHFSYDEFPKEIKSLYYSSLEDVVNTLSVIRQKYSSDEEIASKYLSKPESQRLLLTMYFKANPRQYSNFCRFVLENSRKNDSQVSDKWIGNHGFNLDRNSHFEVNGSSMTVFLNHGNVVFQGWAADFINGIPLADVFVRVGKKFYSLNYGSENVNLAKVFGNEHLADICFKGEVPIQAFKGMWARTVCFTMVGFHDGELYTYPEIKYNLKVK